MIRPTMHRELGNPPREPEIPVVHDPEPEHPSVPDLPPPVPDPPDVVGRRRRKP